MMFPVSKLLGRTYEPLNLIELNAAKLINNYRFLSSLSPLKISPVLKSNAYGHGLIPTAKILDPLKPPFFCVDSLYEAYELLKNGVQTPILIMGYINPKSLKTKKLPFHFAVYDMDLLQALAKYQPQAPVHLFVDTGMHREGITEKNSPDFIRFFIGSRAKKIEGLMSHLAIANNPENPLTKLQVNKFNRFKNTLAKQNLHPEYFHLGSTSYLHAGGTLAGNMIRSGLALYGIDPCFDKKELQPVLQLKTKIVQIKTVNKGESVGYDATYIASGKTKVGIIPVGYSDGIDRKLSNRGYVSVKGVFCRYLGRISMNLSAVDVSDVPDTRVNDECLVISASPGDKNSVQNIAGLCETIPYEIIARLNPSIRRVII